MGCQSKKSASVMAVSISPKRGTKKRNVKNALAKENYGIENDAHAGEWERQVSLLDYSSIEKMLGQGMEIKPGDFAENITTEGISFKNISIGDVIKIGGSVRISITKKGKTCHNRCEIYNTIGDCVMPKEGVFGRILSGGNIKVGDTICLE